MHTATFAAKAFRQASMAVGAITGAALDISDAPAICLPAMCHAIFATEENRLPKTAHAAERARRHSADD